MIWGFNKTALKEETPGDNISANLRRWDQGHTWECDGDEWTGQAALCGISYSTWKASLCDTLIRPNIGPAVHAIEIAPGHGRWSEFLIAESAFVTLVDLSPSCLTFCRDKFADFKNVDYYLTTGSSLPRYAEKIDFIFSFDSFVHMAPEIIRGYVTEFARVLRSGGTAIIHHANIDNPRSHSQASHPGWRSAVNAEIIRELAAEAGLQVNSQFQYWDPAQKIGVPRFGDIITVLKG